MAEMPNRRSIRLKGYDYAQEGAYYVTICTHVRAHLFGEIVNAVMEPTRMGEIHVLVSSGSITASSHPGSRPGPAAAS